MKEKKKKRKIKSEYDLIIKTIKRKLNKRKLQRINPKDQKELTKKERTYDMYYYIIHILRQC